MQQLLQSAYLINEWSINIMSLNLPVHMQCACERICDPASSETNLGRFIFVEVDVELLILMQFQSLFPSEGTLIT